jgi:L-ascorbate metabolism protein UlaG (beta-lactamase superfamily)
MDVTITKLVHSCLLVDVGGNRFLIDPGGFTWDDERFDPDMVEGADRILITHEHADHVSYDFLRAALERSNGAEVETTPNLVRMLAEQGIEAVDSGTPHFVAPHERIPFGSGPPNTGFHIAGAVSHPGDSHSFNETMPILAMPFVAPWGSLTQGVDRVRLVEPRFVIPIHDWFLSGAGKAFMYRLAHAALADDGIELVVIDDFSTTTIGI